MAGWHHWLDGCESEWTPGVGDGQGGLAGCSSWGCKESDMTEWLNWTELGNKEFIIWATVSSRSCFCWLYTASPSLVAKKIIWFQCWPPGDVHVQSLLLCCWRRVFAMSSAFSWQNSISLCPALFYTSRPNMPVIPGVSWLPTFALQYVIMKRTSFWGVSSRSSGTSS